MTETEFTGEDAVATATLPLDAWHRTRGGRMVEFAGYWMPIQYEGIMAEHLWVRENAGLFDVSHMGQLALSGEGAADALEALVPGDISALKPGRMRYSLLLAEDGLHPRELSDPERRMNVMDVAEQWAVLNTAGITEDDVLAVTRDRVLMRVEQYRTVATRLKAAAGDCLTFAPPKASVPDGDRWGYGPTLSQRDIDGAQRVVAVARLEALAAAAAPPVEAIFDGVVSSLARRHSRGRGSARFGNSARRG